MIRTRVSLWLLGCLGMFLCLSQVEPAEGYILPARFYLRQLLKSRNALSSLKIRQTTTELSENGKRTYDEHIYIRFPGQIRVERWEGGKRTQIELLMPKSASRWRAGGQTKQLKRTPRPRFDFFGVSSAGSGYGDVFDLLAALKVHFRGWRVWEKDSDYRLQKRVSLAWFGRGPAIVFGADFGKRTRNQFWVNKKSLAPVRFLGKIGNQSARSDIQFLDYYTSSKGHLFPGRTLVYKNKRLVLRSLVYQVKVNKTIPNSLFQTLP